jgi:hypothetical protein
VFLEGGGEAYVVLHQQNPIETLVHGRGQHLDRREEGAVGSLCRERSGIVRTHCGVKGDALVECRRREVSPQLLRGGAPPVTAIREVDDAGLVEEFDQVHESRFMAQLHEKVRGSAPALSGSGVRGGRVG